MRRISLVVLAILLTACNAQTPASPAQTQSPAPAIDATATEVPAPSATVSPTVAATSTPTPAPQITRWFWAVGTDKIFAFNAEGQVNTVLDTSGIETAQPPGPPIRVSDDRAIAFFANNDDPKAYILTSDSATPIDLPEVHATFPENGWSVQAHHGPYFVMTPTGQYTAPAILINGESGEATLLAPDVYSETGFDFFVRFSADGKFLRFATNPDKGGIHKFVHNRDLLSGEETVTPHSGKFLVTDSNGELWFDQDIHSGWDRAGTTADGQPLTVMDESFPVPLNNGWILTTPRDCDSPCPLQASPAAGDEAPLNYALPAKLVFGEVYVLAGQWLPQNRLLVFTVDGPFAYPRPWLLSPDGTSQPLGKAFQPILRYSEGTSPDGRYLLAYSADDGSAYTLYDLTTGQALFSHEMDPTTFLDVTYSAEGVIIQQVFPWRGWVYNFAEGAAYEINIGSDSALCTAFSPNGDPICMTQVGIWRYDPVSETRTPLIEEPVNQLSN